MKKTVSREKKMFLLSLSFFMAAVLILGYIAISDYLAERSHEKEILAYEKLVEEFMETENEGGQDTEAVWQMVDQYNRKLAKSSKKIDFVNGGTKDEEYRSLLNISNGMMGYLEIPSIGVRLPIYHGTGDDVLAGGVGHLEGSSLPGGGPGTHCILSSHSGLAAKLFTDLNKVRIGDRFSIRVLDRTLEYEIDEIVTVIPSDTSRFVFDPEEDYVTLFTCTPIGINSHRLLVRGRRV